jgi:hypothetical protein
MTPRARTRYEELVAAPEAPLTRRGFAVLGSVLTATFAAAFVVVETHTKGVLGLGILIVALFAFVFGYLALVRDVMIRIHRRLLRSSRSDRFRITIFFGAFGAIALTTIAAFVLIPMAIVGTN